MISHTDAYNPGTLTPAAVRARVATPQAAYFPAFDRVIVGLYEPDVPAVAAEDTLGGVIPDASESSHRT